MCKLRSVLYLYISETNTPDRLEKKSQLIEIKENLQWAVLTRTSPVWVQGKWHSPTNSPGLPGHDSLALSFLGPSPKNAPLYQPLDLRSVLSA